MIRHLAAMGIWLASAACGADDGRPAASSLDGAPATAWSTARGDVPAAEALGPSVTLATYNVNYGLAGDAATLAAIEALDVDAVFLQETTAAWESHLRPLASRYPHMAFRHMGGAGGLAVLSKRPFVEKDYVHPDGAWFPAWRVVIDTPLGPLQVVNVHLRPNISDGGSVLSGLFTTPAERRREIRHYIATLESALPAVFVGDFNETADGLAVQELAALGMRSALREHGGPQHTWHWQTSVGELRKQLDHVVYDERLVVTRAEVVFSGRSDHYPVVATLHRRPGAATSTATPSLGHPGSWGSSQRSRTSSLGAP